MMRWRSPVPSPTPASSEAGRRSSETCWQPSSRFGKPIAAFGLNAGTGSGTPVLLMRLSTPPPILERYYDLASAGDIRHVNRVRNDLSCGFRQCGAPFDDRTFDANCGMHLGAFQCERPSSSDAKAATCSKHEGLFFYNPSSISPIPADACSDAQSSARFLQCHCATARRRAFARWRT